MLSDSTKLLTPEEHHWWNIQSVLARHNGLDLSIEQAEIIYKYEQEKENKSGKYFLSYWEECDFNLITYKEILTAKQFDNYESFLKTQINLYEEALKTTDIKPERINETGYYSEMFKFYKEHLFSEFAKISVEELFEKTTYDIQKIEYLKKAYKIFLNDSRKKLIIDHLRGNRIFSPNELKVSLLRHSIGYLWPDYISFKKEMEPEVKNISVNLEDQLLLMPDEISDFINNKLEALRNFNQSNFEKYYSNLKVDYFVSGSETNEEMKVNLLMNFLLFDKEKYTARSKGVLPGDPDAPLIYL